jgi:hypothetical protein
VTIPDDEDEIDLRDSPPQPAVVSKEETLKGIANWTLEQGAIGYTPRGTVSLLLLLQCGD